MIYELPFIFLLFLHILTNGVNIYTSIKTKRNNISKATNIKGPHNPKKAILCISSHSISCLIIYTNRVAPIRPNTYQAIIKPVTIK